MKARIRELLRAVPFQPFIIRMVDGAEHCIEDPSFVVASPQVKSSVIVEERLIDRMHCLSPSRICSVEPIA